MLALYPLLIVPEFHERIWGTRDLRPYFNLSVEGEPIGEVWLTGEECKIANGPLAGQSLRELCTKFGAELTGKASPEPNRFPLLIKFLFPREKLSVQVHPDDNRARQIGHPCGKTECWYAASADEGATVGVGLRAGITRDTFRRSVESLQAEQMLNWLDVHTGDMVYVPAGTAHAIGPNAVFIETQQNCDITYRLYDYGRPRQLHLEHGLAAIEENTHAGRVLTRGIVCPEGCGGHELLVASPSFIVEKHKIDHPLVLSSDPDNSSVQILVSLSGGALIECPGSQPLRLVPGQAIVIPACLSECTLRAQITAEFLRMRLPSGA
jgi:mannose-6-phosphate isomerase